MRVSGETVQLDVFSCDRTDVELAALLKRLDVGDDVGVVHPGEHRHLLASLRGGGRRRDGTKSGVNF